MRIAAYYAVAQQQQTVRSSYYVISALSVHIIGTARNLIHSLRPAFTCLPQISFTFAPLSIIFYTYALSSQFFHIRPISHPHQPYRLISLGLVQ
jgi:hypothetical protein